jgi:hypothetical protein
MKQGLSNLTGFKKIILILRLDKSIRGNEVTESNMFWFFWLDCVVNLQSLTWQSLFSSDLDHLMCNNHFNYFLFNFFSLM